MSSTDKELNFKNELLSARDKILACIREENVSLNHLQAVVFIQLCTVYQVGFSDGFAEKETAQSLSDEELANKKLENYYRAQGCEDCD